MSSGTRGDGDVNDEAAWLAGVAARSATGRAVLAVDWAATPFGAPSSWPGAQRTLVRLCMTTRVPMLLAWGPDLRMLYNDGFRDMLGDLHPAAIGAPFSEVWAGMWDVIGPMVDHVLRTAEPLWAEHQRLLLDRRGFVEETYFTFALSPALDDDGRRAGLVVVATETTGQVLAQRRLAALTSLGIAAFSAPRVTDVCVAATTELARWAGDVAHVDIHLRVNDDLVLIASTAQTERTRVDARVLEEASRRRVRTTVAPPDAPDGPPVGVVLPLLAGDGGPDGALYVEPSSTLPFTAEHEQFLGAVAQTIAAALGAAHSRAVELGEQRHINETLQQAMLRPASDHPTVAARYRPAAFDLAVGGDWYDVIDVDAHRRAMVVGDCVGHGLQAATAMGQLRSASRALLLEGHDPATVLERLDVFAASIPGAFASSVACVVIDRLAATVRYSRAGHVPPLLIDRHGARWLDAAGGPLLQIDPDAERPQATMEYAHGDLLVLYTDGLVERRHEAIDVGLLRLAEAARRWEGGGHSPQAIADGMLRDLLTVRRQDDVVLVVKRLVIDPPVPA